MNIGYLYSIISLYLSKENNSKTHLQVIKNLDNKVEFKFGMDNISQDKTSFSIPYDIVMLDDNLSMFIKEYKKDLIVINENYENSSRFEVTFSNGRTISFTNFSLIELNNIRNIIYNIDFQKEEIRIEFEKKNLKTKAMPLRLQETGFTNYKTIILVTMGFLIIFILSLWLVPKFIK